MMFMSRHGGGRLLRAFAIASALVVGVGAIALAVRAEPASATSRAAFVAADPDGGTPAAMADALWAREYAALPGVRLIRVDGSRHFILADQPARFAAVIDQFLAD